MLYEFGNHVGLYFSFSFIGDGCCAKAWAPQCDNNHSTRNYGVRPSWNSRRGPRGGFVPPIRNNGGSGTTISRVTGKGDDSMEDSTRKWFVFPYQPPDTI